MITKLLLAVCGLVAAAIAQEPRAIAIDGLGEFHACMKGPSVKRCVPLNRSVSDLLFRCHVICQGPAVVSLSPEGLPELRLCYRSSLCMGADFDRDEDVDLADWNELMARATDAFDAGYRETFP